MTRSEFESDAEGLQTAHETEVSVARRSSPAHSPPERSWVANVFGIVLRALLPLVILAMGGIAFVYLSKEPPEKQLPPAEKQKIKTKVATLQVADYALVVKTNGIVQPRNEVEISAEVAGLVTRVSPEFEVGAYFQKGDVLIELDERDYRTAVAIADAQKIGAEAALDLAKETYERNSALYKRKGISQAILKQSYAAMLQAQALLESSEAQLEQSKRNLARTKIAAPFDGRVRLKNIGIGQSVGTGTPLGVVFAVDFAEVRLPIASKELQYLTLPELPTDPAVEVQLTDAINPENPAVWRGRILRTEGTLDLNSLELFAIAQIEDPFGRKSGKSPLRIGQPVVASITGKTLNDMVAIPREAVRQLDQIYLVNREGEELVLESRKVKPVWTDEQHLIVDDPELRDGQLIATTRIVYAPDGAKCEIIHDIADDEVMTDAATSNSTAKEKKEKT